MDRHARAAVVVFAAVMAVSCSATDSDSMLTQPGFVNTASISIAAVSPAVSAQVVSNPFCPSIAPFHASFGVILRAGSLPFVIERVRFGFVDTSGLQAPQVTVPMPSVTTPAPNLAFGSATVGAGSTVTLPLSLGFGCGTGRRGTIVIIVDTSDNRGHRGSHQASVRVQ